MSPQPPAQPQDGPAGPTPTEVRHARSQLSELQSRLLDTRDRRRQRDGEA